MRGGTKAEEAAAASSQLRKVVSHEATRVLETVERDQLVTRGDLRSPGNNPNRQEH